MTTHGRRVTFEGLSGWFTLAANIVTIAGLVVVVVELNQNQKVQRAQARHELSTTIVNVLMESANNQQLSGVIYRASRGARLSPEEQLQFEMRTNAILRYWEDVHYQYRMGLYDEEEFDRQREAWNVTLRDSPGMQDYWCRVRRLYSPSFADELNRLLPPGSCTGKRTRS
jgi:hypothetical protein